MTVKFYLGEQYEHPQENEAFRLLCSAGSSLLTGNAAIIGNLHYGTGQMDALVLSGTSITIVDFKDCGGAVRISENGKWQTDTGFMIAGGKGDENPYHQVRRYKRDLARWLDASGLLPFPNDLGHISCLVMFTRPMTINDADMGETVKKWFRASNVQGGLEFLCTRASRSLDLSADRMDRIVGALRVKPYEFKPSESWVPMSRLERTRRETDEILRDLDDQRMQKWELENRTRIQEDYKMACRGWTIDDALADIHRALERRHPGTAFAEEVVAALRCALGGGKPSLSAVLRMYQPRTGADLTNALQNRGVEPSEFA